MAQPHLQPSFNSGEWSPNLHARVDIDKYKSGAALLRNFFVDYRGGASTRTGTKYVLRALDSDNPVRLIPFQASFTVAYILEFGEEYIRFHRDGAPILETGVTITGITNADPAVVSAVNTYTDGDWVYISGVSGMTQVNGRYFIVANASGTDFELTDLNGVNVNSSAYGVWTANGSAQRVYTIVSPYAAADLAILKFAQNVDTMILCHPDYAPQSLEIITETNWIIGAITFGTDIAAPVTVSTSTTLGGGTTNYSYIVTAVDGNGQESEQSTAFTILSAANIASVQGTNTLTWESVTGAVSYNVYKTNTTSVNPVPVGAAYGFIGNSTSTQFADSNIAPDFNQGPPIIRNPFALGSGVTGAVITNGGSYTSKPTVTFSAPPAGITATGNTLLQVATVSSIAAGGAGYVINDTMTFTGNLILTVTTIGGGGSVTVVTITNRGVYSGALPGLPLAQTSTSGAGIGATFNLTWQVFAIDITNPGSDYVSAPTITPSAGALAATAVIGPAGTGNPSVPAFFQQRLVLAATPANPQTLYMSQTASYYNFNVSSPSKDDDAITATLVSGQLNGIRSMIPQPAGLIVLSDGSSWLVNGGSFGSAVTPATTVANAQAFVGANDVSPIVVNYDTLYVQSKGSSVRDSSYNFYANVFTGEDVSIIASHLFYGFEVIEWAWAEEPFKIVWAVRDDGTLLSFTFIKEQDFRAWSHSDTEGDFKSVATIIEQVDAVNSVNAVYVVVERTINETPLKYVERFSERIYPDGVEDACQVDSAVTYNGAPATSFTGAEHLAGKTVTGLADGEVITPFVMAANGSFTLASSSKVAVGLAFTPQLQTLQIDLGEPTVQSKQKKINAVTVRTSETLGLRIGSDFDNLVDMKDFVRGNVGSLTNEVVTDLVTGDGRTFIDPKWAEQGQYCIQIDEPYPATILGVMPQVLVGDTK